MRKAITAGGGLLVAALAVGPLAVLPAQAAPVVDELAVVVVGDGITYANVAGPAAIQLIDSTGALGDTIAIPTVGDGEQHPFVIGVNRDQAGALQQSADHSVVTVGGYDAAVGTSDVNGTDAPEVLRVIARVDAEGAVDTSTTLDGAYSERHLRGVASIDGSRYWTGGHGNDSVAPYRAGVFTIEHGGDTPVVVAADDPAANQWNNTRVPVVHDGELYISSDRSGNHGISRVGSGLPTAAAELDLIAAAPTGRSVPHDFAFIGEELYIAYTEGTAALVRYEMISDVWTATDAVPGAFWNLTGRVAGDQTVLYAVRGANSGNEIVRLVHDTEGAFADAQQDVIATAPTSTAFRGISFAPGFAPSDDPIELPDPGAALTWDVRVAGGAGNALSAVLGASSNPVATGTVIDPLEADFEVSVSSGDPAVVADADIEVTVAADGRLTLAAEPAAVGRTTITVTVTTEDERVTDFPLDYWVSAAIADPTALAHVGMADASAAYDVGDDHMLVADDDSNQIRLYGPTFGESVAEFDLSEFIDHPTDRTFDLEGAARVDDTIYWVGSLGNSRSGNYWPHRDIVLATTVNAAGAATTLDYAGEATGFREALVEWDNGDGHGEGAGAFQFERATEPGYSAEGSNSLNLEGATIAPDGTTLWLGFRSPLLPVAADPATGPAGDTALIVGIENIAEVVSGDAALVVNEYHSLDLDGRAIRDLTETEDGKYLIAAGSADDSGNFALYGWTGNPADDPVVSVTPLGLDGWGGSYEALPFVPSLSDGTVIRVLQDVGTVDIYGIGAEAQDLTREFMKFVSHDYVLDFDGAFGLSLVLDLDQVLPGAEVRATARGFAPGELVSFTLHSEPVELAEVAADEAGVIEVLLTVPEDAEPGEHRLVAAAASGEAEASLTVLAPRAEMLPTTGVDTTQAMVLFALLMLLAGAGAGLSVRAVAARKAA